MPGLSGNLVRDEVGGLGEGPRFLGEMAAIVPADPGEQVGGRRVFQVSSASGAPAGPAARAEILATVLAACSACTEFAGIGAGETTALEDGERLSCPARTPAR